MSKPFSETPDKKTGIRRFALDAAFQGVNRLFVFAFEDTRADEAADAPEPRNLVANRVIRDRYRKYFIPRVDITSYNEVEIFMINQLMIQLENVMKLERSRLEKEIITRFIY